MLLGEMQKAFAEAIIGDGVLKPHIAVNGVDQEKRFAVYRNNVYHNLRRALRAVYPVVEKLVGERFFDWAADRYIRACPSVSGDIHGFGGSLSEFLAGFPSAAGLTYLPDMARLEWAMHEVFHAPGHAPLALERLRQLPEASYATLRFTLHPACRLLSSRFPLHRIWQLNQASAEWEGTVDIGSGGASMLVRRNGFSVELEPLADATFMMLQSLAGGQTVGAAYESAMQVDELFDLGQFILRQVSEETIVDVIREC